ncbi:hypothetical protein MNBD_GAMMA12-1721 [hydrothermal vent metagenome]|uniref:O-antigen ligase-related domain-containing protein n=1 Tax=hydrothermal vent metagenome TaxID=652676 RepID=A0A3B0XXS0_9ZZZZ
MHEQAVTKWIRINYAWVLISSCLIFFTTRTSFNLPLVIMAIIGLVIIIRKREKIRQHSKAYRIIWLLFLCLWIPILLSLPDAVNFARSSGITARYLLFPLAGVFILYVMQHEFVRLRITQAILLILALFSFDGLVQYFWGYNLLGYPPMGGSRLTGFFSPKPLLGTILAIFSPLVFELIRKTRLRYPIVWLLLPLFIVLILLGGGRHAWIMFIMAGAIYGLLMLLLHYSKIQFRTSLLAGAIVIISIATASQIPYVKSRIGKTTGVFSTDFDKFDKSTSYRLSLWVVARNMYFNNPVNGVGPRGYRYAYADNALKSNFWMNRGKNEIGSTHPHLFILEVSSETGIIGLLGYLLFYIILIRYYWQCDKKNKQQMTPWFIIIFIAFFPLNSFMALYGSFWGMVSWWMLAVGIGFSQSPNVKIKKQPQ